MSQATVKILNFNKFKDKFVVCQYLNDMQTLLTNDYQLSNIVFTYKHSTD